MDNQMSSRKLGSSSADLKGDLAPRTDPYLCIRKLPSFTLTKRPRPWKEFCFCYIMGDKLHLSFTAKFQQ